MMDEVPYSWTGAIWYVKLYYIVIQFSTSATFNRILQAACWLGNSMSFSSHHLKLLRLRNSVVMSFDMVEMPSEALWECRAREWEDSLYDQR